MFIHFLRNHQESHINNGVNINGTLTSLKFVALSNFSSDGEEFTCLFTNSEGVARKTFKVQLLKSDPSTGIYATVGFGVVIGVVIAVVIIVTLLSCLIRSIYLTKVFLLVSAYFGNKQKSSNFFLETRSKI